MLTVLTRFSNHVLSCSQWYFFSPDHASRAWQHYRLARVPINIYATRSTKYHVFPLASNGARTRQEVRDFCDWNSQMMHLLRDLISALHDTVGAWEKFERSSITYFSHHGKLPNSSQVDQSVSVATIGKTFTDLKDILHKLEYLEKTLGESVSQIKSFLGKEDKIHHLVRQKLIEL